MSELSHWHCDVCGREYEDANPQEVARWNTRVATTGFCCEECREDNEEPSRDSDLENTHEPQV